MFSMELNNAYMIYHQLSLRKTSLKKYSMIQNHNQRENKSHKAQVFLIDYLVDTNYLSKKFSKVSLQVKRFHLSCFKPRTIMSLWIRRSIWHDSQLYPFSRQLCRITCKNHLFWCSQGFLSLHCVNT